MATNLRTNTPTRSSLLGMAIDNDMHEHIY